MAADGAVLLGRGEVRARAVLSLDELARGAVRRRDKEGGRGDG